MSTRVKQVNGGIFSGFLTFLKGEQKPDEDDDLACFENTLRNVKKGALAVPAGSANLRYDPTLIPTLEKQHEVLVKMFVETRTNVEQRKYTEANEVMRKFYDLFGNHLFRENFQLYGFLKQMERLGQISDDDASMTKDLKEKMVGIQLTVKREIEQFIGDGVRFKYPGVTEENRKEFFRVWDELQGVLLHRIDTEENSLYLVYESFNPNN